MVFASGENPWLVHQIYLIPALHRLRNRGDVLSVAVSEELPSFTPPIPSSKLASGPWSGRLRESSLLKEIEPLPPPLECGGAIISVRCKVLHAVIDTLAGFQPTSNLSVGANKPERRHLVRKRSTIS
jgi:hypothetical protein